MYTKIEKSIISKFGEKPFKGLAVLSILTIISITAVYNIKKFNNTIGVEKLNSALITVTQYPVDKINLSENISNAPKEIAEELMVIQYHLIANDKKPKLGVTRYTKDQIGYYVLAANEILGQANHETISN
jgi:hypothetical protein